MKKLLAILMALAMVFSLAACGDKDKDDDKKDKTTTSADVNNGGEEIEEELEDELFDAAEAYYDAIASRDGKKIKAAMPEFFAEYFEKEDLLGSFTDEEAMWIEQLYGIDLSDPDAAFDFYAIGVLEEFGDVDSITVTKVKDCKKYSKAELADENESLTEMGLTDYEIKDAADANVEISVLTADGQKTVTTQPLSFYKLEDDWKATPDTEEEEDVTDEPADDPSTEATAINNAASAYYAAILSGNGASVKNSMSGIFDKFLEYEDPFADLTAEEKAQAEAEFGISFADPNAFYAYYAAMVKSEYDGLAAIQVVSVDYEAYTADEVAEMNSELAAEGITGINITGCADAEVELLITYTDGTTTTETQYISFIAESGVWKAFPDM